MQAEFRKTKDELVYDNILEGPENMQTDLQGTTNKIYWPKQMWKRVVVLSVLGG